MSDIPPLDYADHLFQERQVRSVTANTRADGEELLDLAAGLRLRLAVTNPTASGRWIAGAGRPPRWRVLRLRW